MFVSNQKTTEQTDSVPSPANKPSWRFGDLSAAALMPQLQRHLLDQDTKASWQFVWLNNDGQPVIGLLPKVSWSVYPADEHSSNDSLNTYKVIKNCRGTDLNSVIGMDNSHAITTTYLSYLEWQDALIAYSNAQKADNDTAYIDTQQSTKSNYHHGLIGFIGYDITAYELSPADRIELAMQPCASLGHYDIYLTPEETDQAETGNVGWVLKTHLTNDDASENIGHKTKDTLLTALTSYLDELDQKLSDKYLNQVQFKASLNMTPLVLQSRWSKEDYQQAFNQTQDYLQQGDCYQINLTQKWSGCLPYNHDSTQSTSALIDYLPALYRNTKAPFAGYLSVSDVTDNINTHIPTHPFELLSCSPELFFTFTKDHNTGKHRILTKPIKGTMPRGITDEQDESYKQQLTHSEKDRAENVMIVDLLRNDLGKYAKIGSVKVPQLFAIESFSNVHHMVSTISAELKTDTHPLAVLFGSLPAGSITGTPKKRAVEIIAELETTPRGAYCGTMGYMNFDGSGQWNVLIRTLQANASSHNELDTARHVNLWAGGGITVASDCDAEYQECLDKVGNLLSVLAQKS
ncbi:MULTISPECIES: anthranilate synthase component I family protein [unclassified Psychrobacter]|uniref:anthranilate synthase component I family protein n=1 Tax=unclassified Psychrobacter TaxID=196806 RepID=UPI0025B2BADD|nr:MULTISPECIES: anthranilate synthase component I family protein [unclassified Psychrobacter]MDN3451966.1 anthranilate synthase component I family protein [Psychrobacter sp. APC 3350]MDN3501755.1 anthranilate synthase component I family protein [Psychrobacter sp. 5A.1]